MSIGLSAAPRVAVLGGSGFIGWALAEGWPKEALAQPTFLVHRSRPAWLEAVGVGSREISLDDSNSVQQALRDHDVLINLLRPDGSGWYPETLRRLVPSFRDSGIQRCVHASSIDVYAGVKAAVIDEKMNPRPLSPYESEHVAAERILTEAFNETIVLRLGAVFGIGGRNLVSLADEMRYAPTWKLVLRRALYGDRRMHLVSVESVCDALLAAASRKGMLDSRTIVVTDDANPDNNFAFVQDRLAEAFARQAFPRVPVLPRIFLHMALRSRGLPTAAVDRRFSGEEASSFGVTSDQFTDRLRSYASVLADQARRGAGA